jgi:uncharacterized protein YutE (UPF0331/DUF86 family)
VTGAATIVRYLEQLRTYLDRLAELRQHSREALRNDWHVQSMVERNLQLAIEVVIGVCEQVIAGLSLPTPESGREALATLANAGVIGHELAGALQQAVGFRNIIVHQYMSIDYDLVYDALHNDLGAVEAFLAAVSAFIQTQP